MLEHRTPVVIDTDIGTDADDALALALACSAEGLELLAVTTVYADAPLRAGVARHVLGLAGRSDVSVHAGLSSPSSSPLVDSFHYPAKLWGHEDRELPRRSTANGVREENDAARDSDEAADAIVDLAQRRPGEVTLIAIGPLTNVARALEIEPGLPSLLKRLICMGGVIDLPAFPLPPSYETNFNADPLASERVLAAGFTLLLVPAEVTLRTSIDEDGLLRLAAAGRLGATLGRMAASTQEALANLQLKRSLQGVAFDSRVYLHDPLAVYCSYSAELTTTRRQLLHTRRSAEGLVLEHDVNAQPIDSVVTVDADAFAEHFLARIERYAAQHRSAGL